MTLTNFYAALAQLSGWLFIVASLLALGMSHTVPMIRQPVSVAGASSAKNADSDKETT
jgi:hypothetical protein